MLARQTCPFTRESNDERQQWQDRQLRSPVGVSLRVRPSCPRQQHDFRVRTAVPYAGGTVGRTRRAGGEWQKPANFDTMEAQMRRTYENAQVLLAELGGSLADVVEETLFIIDVPAAFAASGKVRPAVYGQPVPQVASNLIGVPALAFPEQLIEIAFRAEVQS